MHGRNDADIGVTMEPPDVQGWMEHLPAGTWLALAPVGGATDHYRLLELVSTQHVAPSGRFPKMEEGEAQPLRGSLVLKGRLLPARVDADSSDAELANAGRCSGSMQVSVSCNRVLCLMADVSNGDDGNAIIPACSHGRACEALQEVDLQVELGEEGEEREEGEGVEVPESP